MSNKFMFNIVKDHLSILGPRPLLCCNFKLLNIKAATAHFPVISQEVNELLAKGTIEPSVDGADLYSCICSS